MGFAYLDSVSDLGSHDFLILDDQNRLREDREFLEIRQALAHLGHKQVDWRQAREAEYGEVHLVPSIGLDEEALRELRAINYRALIAYGDGLNNHVYFPNSIARDVVQLVHCGFRLIERELLSTSLSKNVAETSHIIPFTSIAKTWGSLSLLLGEMEKPPLLGKGDLLFCERYWGRHQYLMHADADCDKYLRSVLQLEEKRYTRVVFRPTTRPGPENLKWETALRDYAKETQVEFITWSGVYEESASPSILDHPEAQLFLGNLKDLGGLFAFDGSLSMLFGTLNTNTSVHWGDWVNTEDLFIDKQTPNLVTEQIMLMRSASAILFQEQGKRDGGVVSITISGSSSALAQERAQFAQARAQLAAINASLSWRVTKPLRFLRMLLPN
jgi:hypothetical protein